MFQECWFFAVLCFRAVAEGRRELAVTTSNRSCTGGLLHLTEFLSCDHRLKLWKVAYALLRLNLCDILCSGVFLFSYSRSRVLHCFSFCSPDDAFLRDWSDWRLPVLWWWAFIFGQMGWLHGANVGSHAVSCGSQQTKSWRHEPCTRSSSWWCPTPSSRCFPTVWRSSELHESKKIWLHLLCRLFFIHLITKSNLFNQILCDFRPFRARAATQRAHEFTCTRHSCVRENMFGHNVTSWNNVFQCDSVSCNVFWSHTWLKMTQNRCIAQ